MLLDVVAVDSGGIGASINFYSDILKVKIGEICTVKSADDFFIDNLRLSISEPQKNVVIPAYQDTIRIQKLELAE